MTCPAQQEGDEMVCTRRLCGLRWDAHEERPRCPVFTLAEAEAAYAQERFVQELDARPRHSPMTMESRERADRIYGAWGMAGGPGRDDPYEIFLWLTLNYKVTLK